MRIVRPFLRFRPARIASASASRYPLTMPSKRWTWLTAAALLFAGVTNAHSHVHYCFDGRAPATAVYHVDGLDHTHAIPAPHAHDHDENGADHDDLDLDVPNDALAKTVKHDLPAVVPALLWTAHLAPASSTVCAPVGDPVPAPDPPHSRPPSRGPPR
jgi:hypothetical protein